MDFRTNLGITNPGDQVATVTVHLIGKDGQTLGSLQTTVAPRGMRQINNVNRILLNSTTVSNREGYLRLESDQPILGWTSQIDNLSEHLSLVVGKVAGTNTRLLIPSTASTGRFTSTLAVVNLASSATTVQLMARDKAGDLKKPPSQATIPANGFISSSDILSSLGLEGSFGPLEVESMDSQPLQAVSCIYTPQRTGGYFEGVAIEP